MSLPIDRSTYFKPLVCNAGEGYSLRGGIAPPVSLVIHTTNGNVGSKFENECRFLAESHVVSAHYLIGKEGQVARFLAPLEHVAWHAGAAIAPFGNARSIGIECHLAISEQWTREMRNTLTLLVLEICAEYRTVGNLRTHMETHRAVALPKGRKSDPAGMTDADFYAWRDVLQDVRACREKRT